MDTQITTTIPYSPEAEEGLLGAVLINPDAYFDAADFLKADDFFIQQHQLIWNAFRRLNENHVPLDLLSERGLANYLFARGAVGREFAYPRITLSAQH